MTRASELANILKKLGDAHYQAADELLALASNDSASPERLAGPAAAPARDAAPASFDSAEFEEVPFAEYAEPAALDPQGSEVNCPKHRKPYLPSKFKEGKFYCPADSDEPAWSNSKGKCRITPDNAAQWLRMHSGAAA